MLLRMFIFPTLQNLPGFLPDMQFLSITGPAPVQGKLCVCWGGVHVYAECLLGYSRNWRHSPKED